MGGGVDNRLFVQTQPNMPGAWILSAQIITPAGRPASSEPATQACAGNTSTTKTCDAYDHQQTSYPTRPTTQPAL